MDEIRSDDWPSWHGTMALTLWWASFVRIGFSNKVLDHRKSDRTIKDHSKTDGETLFSLGDDRIVSGDSLEGDDAMARDAALRLPDERFIKKIQRIGPLRI